MLKLQKKHDAQALAPYVASLALPNAGAWFRATFGDEIGAQLAPVYGRAQIDLPLSFPEVLRQINSKHMTVARAVLFTDSCNADATEQEYTVLISRAKEQPLYDVRLTSYSEGAALLYFAYVDGAFRYISNFRLRPPASFSPVKVSSNPKLTVPGMTVPKLVDRVFPVYPEDAKREHIEGKVLLHAIIGKDGRVCSLQVTEGERLLAQAAMAAVRQWRYSPYTLNGQPVAVDTTITIIFNWGSD
ncbi:MAG: energy transducer TonB [Candidatus Acidiferrales bacterium]